jgi:hypothetical protein
MSHEPDDSSKPQSSQDLAVVDEVALHLPDGLVVLKSGKVVRPVPQPTEKPVEQKSVRVAREIKSGRQASEALERIHRKLGDLPEQAEKMNAIACVLMYTGVGLDDGDIALALKTSVENIMRLKQLDAYRQLSEMFDKAVFDDAKTQANHIVSRAAARAAHRIVDFIDDDDALVSMSASKEVARMAGIGVDRLDPAKVSSLNITIKRKGDNDDVTVEVNHAAS